MDSSYVFLFLHAVLQCHKVAQVKVNLLRRILCGDTFSLDDATFLFYANKSLGAEEAAAYLSTLTINLSDEHRLPAFI